MGRWILRWGLWIALLGLLPGMAAAARPAAVELRGRAGGLGQLALVAFDSGGQYVAAERLAALLKGSWKAKGPRGTLTVGARSAQFTRNESRVLLGGASIALAAPTRLGASGWLLPADFLAKGLGKLVPGVTSARLVAPAPVSAKSAGARPAGPGEGAAPVSAKPAAGRSAGPVEGVAPVSAKSAGARPAGPAEGAPPTSAKPAAARSGGPVVAFGDLRLRSYPSFTRVVIEAGGGLTFAVESTRDEVRMRLRSLGLSGPHGREVDDGLVKALKLEPDDADALLRVTLEGTAGQVKAFALQDPHRVVLDIYRPKEPVAEGPRGGAQQSPLTLIVLDAGHGGHDPGATGPSGLTEKEVVLDVTKRVARMVEESRLGVKVAMTRSTDVFVPLRDRTNFANKQRADLFLSIHANAHPRSVSEGVETYFLSSEATDNEARQVAAIENGVIQLESPGSRQKTDALKSILWDLAQSEFQQESSVFAETVQDSMTRSLQLVNRGVKQAGFYVLGGAAMPAVLVEIGFLTNPKEEKKLSTAEHRESVARAILAGITDYKRRYDQRMRATARTDAASPRAVAASPKIDAVAR